MRYLMHKIRRFLGYPRSRRRRIIARLLHLALDERGGEVLEYAVVAGLIVTGAIGAISCVGTKVVAKWNSINNSI